MDTLADVLLKAIREANELADEMGYNITEDRERFLAGYLVSRLHDLGFIK